MKSNHNIDKIFAQKLASLEDAPSEQAWLTIQKGIVQKKKKKAIWFPYVAAAAVALLIVSAVWMHEQAETSGIDVAQNPVKPNKIEQITTLVQPKKITQQPDDSYIAEKYTQKKEVFVQPEQSSSKENPVIKKAQKAVPSQQKQPTPLVTELPVPAIEDKLATLIPAQKTVPLTTLSQSNTIVVTVALNEAEAADEPGNGTDQFTEKQSKAGKLLAKLKQLKRGEFDELGIRKETLVAFVKDKTHNSKAHTDNHE